MILGYNGRKTRLAECQNYFSSGRDGVSAWEIIETAEKFGLEASGYEVDASDLDQVPLPAVAYWNNNHFVVVEAWSPQSISVVDPANGRVTYTPSQFKEQFSAVILTFTPNQSFNTKSKNSPSLWRTYLQGMLQTRSAPRFLAKIITASIALQLLNIALPLLTRYLIDDIIGLNLTKPLNIFGLGLLSLILFFLFTTYVRGRWLVLLQAQFDKQIVLNFFAHILSLPITFFQRRTSGDLLNRLGSNMTIRETFTNNTLSTILDGLLILTYLIILITWSPTFAAIVLLLALIQVALLIATAPQVYVLTQRALIGEVNSHSYLLEALHNIVTLKAFGAEDRIQSHWSKLFHDYLDILIKQSFLAAAIEATLSTIRLFSPLLLLWVGAFFVLNNGMSLGTMLALNALAISFLTPLSSLIENGQQLQFVGAHLARVADVMETQPEQNSSETKLSPTLSGQIDMQNISFRYDKSGPLVLQNISLGIQPGQKIALVGHTGSGKSTLAALLLGLHIPEEGQMFFDSYPLGALHYQSIRRQFGVVLQEISLFNASIRDNIALQDHHMPLEKIIRAARLAQIDDEIQAMPMGYETVLGEDGSGLSGGQKQRLMLARALVNQPKILCLDEATSHLDAATEQQIMNNLNSLGITQIVIAHRLSTIQDADQIFVLDKGQIIACGTHDELLADNEHFALLAGKQILSRVPQLDRDRL